MDVERFAVRDNNASRSYEVVADGEVIGALVYGNAEGRVVFLRTVVAPAYRGRGIATRLVDAALADARARGKTVTDYCGFVSAFIEGHPEYADLVDPDHSGAGRGGVGGVGFENPARGAVAGLPR